MCEYTLTSGSASCIGPGPSSQTVTVQGVLKYRQRSVLIVTFLIQRKPRIELQLQHLPRQNHSAQFGHTSAKRHVLTQTARLSNKAPLQTR